MRGTPVDVAEEAGSVVVALVAAVAIAAVDAAVTVGDAVGSTDGWFGAVQAITPLPSTPSTSMLARARSVAWHRDRTPCVTVGAVDPQ